MRRYRARRLGLLDLAILVVSLVLAVWLCLATDREYMAGFGAHPAYVEITGAVTKLPTWIKERQHDAIRSLHSGVAMLTALGLGLAVVVLRPRRRMICPGPFPPGDIAAIATGGLAVILAIRWILKANGFLFDPLASPMSAAGDFFYIMWREAREPVTWTILGAWFTLLATGRWTRPLDAIDCMGRWLAIGWFLLILGQAAVTFIAFW